MARISRGGHREWIGGHVKRRHMNPIELFRDLKATAKRWQDPAHPERKFAHDEIVGHAESVWTGLEVEMALSLFLHRLARLSERVIRPTADVAWSHARTVHFLEGERVPFEGLVDVVSALSAGWRVKWTVDPVLEGAVDRFLGSLSGSGLSRVTAAGAGEVHMRVYHPSAEPVQALGEKEIQLPPRASLFVLDEDVGPKMYERLAQELLLFSGRSERSIRMIAARPGVSIDPLLEAIVHTIAQIRPHPRICARNKMPAALLEAQRIPVAYTTGYEILVSKGEAEIPSRFGQIRWIPWEDPTLDPILDLLGETSLWYGVAREPDVRRTLLQRNMLVGRLGHVFQEPFGPAPQGRSLGSLLHQYVD